MFQRPTAGAGGRSEREPTVTMTDTEAFEAMLAHHRALDDHVARRAGALEVAVESGGHYEPTSADLLAYLADEVLPHALAEEKTVYEAARALPGLADTIDSMVDEHRKLVAAVDQLATASDGPAALLHGSFIRSLFSGHVTKENDLVLPRLASDDSVSLAAVLDEMHRLLEAAHEDAEATTASGPASPDVEAALLKLLLEATGDLAESGQGDRACRLAATAWATVRATRPTLAVRVTAALHRLARSVGSEPVAFSARPPGATVRHEATIDVRSLPPAQRHEQIFATFGALAGGAAFVLVNDHDPKPLRYQLEAEHPGTFTWDYLESGPEVWRVRIGRVNSATGTSPAGAAAPELDVRRLPHGQRHDVIFATYEALGNGNGFVLVNDHDPKPLHYQLDITYGDACTWEYLEAGPRVWRVRIGKVHGADRAAGPGAA